MTTNSSTLVTFLHLGGSMQPTVNQFVNLNTLSIHDNTLARKTYRISDALYRSWGGGVDNSMTNIGYLEIREQIFNFSGIFHDSIIPIRKFAAGIRGSPVGSVGNMTDVLKFDSSWGRGGCGDILD